VVRDADDRGFVVFDVDPLVIGGVHGGHGQAPVEWAMREGQRL